jgi:hypothetical protein
LRRLRACFNQQLLILQEQALQLQAISEQVKQFLPENLAPHCFVAGLNKGCLLLCTDNAVWASQLRFALPELRDKLRKEAKMYQLSSIKIILSTTETIEGSTKAKNSRLSAKAKALILAQTDHCDYPPLKQALQQLARS